MGCKSFNTTGICIPEKHYMADISVKVQKIVTELIAHEKYFTIHRARQFGKSTMLYLLERALRDRWIVINISFEAADDLFQSRYLFAEGLVRRIGKKLHGQNVNADILNAWNAPVSGTFPFEDLSSRITGLCDACEKKIVFMIDEVDKSSDNQIFLSFLGLLRTKYLEREKGEDNTFQSVVLAGVYDIKNLKLKLRQGGETKYNSPWNIAEDFHIDMSLSVQEIGSMLADYEKDHATGMDTEYAAQEIYDYTSGYPYLVSRLCQRIDRDISGQGVFKKKDSAWARAGILEAVSLLLKESNTLFDDMHKKLTEYPALREMLYAMLFYGRSVPYHEQNSLTAIGVMFGFIKERDGQAAVANRIFEIWFYNLFISEDALNNQTYDAGLQAKNQFVKNGKLDMELVLKKFMEHFTDIYRDSPDAFVEENGRRLFLLYLKPIINGTGHYYIESRTRSMGRTDVIVDYLGFQYVVEMKIWRGNEYNERGEKQLIRYLEDYHLKCGYMISFNFNRKKQTGMRKLYFKEKTLVEIIL